MSSLTQPLAIERFSRAAPSKETPVVPFIDLCFIMLFFALNTSAFIFAPGQQVSLAATTTTGTLFASRPVVLTVAPNELYFFMDSKVTRASLSAHLRNYVSSLGSDPSSVPQLLVKADRSIPVEVLFFIMEEGRQAGFGSIHLAAEPIHTDAPLLVSPTPTQ